MTRTLPVPLLAGLIVLLGAVLAAVILIARQVNDDPPARIPAIPRVLPIVCTTANACVPFESAPYVAVRS